MPLHRRSVCLLTYLLTYLLIFLFTVPSVIFE